MIKKNYIVNLIMLVILPLILNSVSLIIRIITMGLAAIKIENFNVLVFAESFLLTSIFVLLGITAIIKAVAPFSNSVRIFRYVIAIIAFLYLVNFFFSEINSLILSKSLGYSPKFFDTYTEYEKAFRITAIILLIICCVLKDSFYKCKITLCILSALFILISDFCSPLYTLVSYGDSIGLRFIINTVLFIYAECSSIITGLSPTKSES